MGAIQNSLNQAIGSVGVAAHAVKYSMGKKDQESEKGKVSQSVDGKLAQQKFNEAMQNLQGNIESIYNNPGFTPRQKKWRATHERNKAAKSFAEFVNGGNE